MACCVVQGDKVRSQVIRMVGESQEAVGAAAGGGSGPGSNKLPTLEEYGTNLTTQANEVSVNCVDPGVLVGYKRWACSVSLHLHHWYTC